VVAVNIPGQLGRRWVAAGGTPFQHGDAARIVADMNGMPFDCQRTTGVKLTID